MTTALLTHAPQAEPTDRRSGKRRGGRRPAAETWAVLSKPRHPVVERALKLARTYYEGHVINDAPALAHAMKVASVLATHEPDAPPSTIASALLHDSPIFAPSFIDLDIVLRDGVGEAIASIVHELSAEQAAMMSGQPPRLAGRTVTLVLAADRIVAFRSLVERARRSSDEREFWTQRQGLRSMLGYFRAWYAIAEPALPASMAIDLGRALHDLESAVLNA